MRTQLSILLFASILSGFSGYSQGIYESKSPSPKQQNLEEWRSNRFGMFIHWGPVSLTGKEIGWSRGGERRGHRSESNPSGTPVEIYDNLYKHFNPSMFDAGQWVKIAKEAGMKYLVFTTKHHDGFVNFDTRFTDYKITSSEALYGKDIVAQLAEACQKHGLKFGVYYSQPDWHHPDYFTGNHDQYIEYLHNQVGELLRSHENIDIMWFDGLGVDPERWHAEELFELVRNIHPQILINNRAGLPGDFDTPEQEIGTYQTGRPWESCITMGTQWAWKPQDQLKSFQECIQTLIRTAGGDGNLLFNVGPMPDGRIEPRQVDRLQKMGDWLDQYGETIYGTEGGPFKPGEWGVSTRKHNVIYLHILNQSGEEFSMDLPAIDARVINSRLLTGGNCTVKQTSEGISIEIPKKHLHETNTIVALELDRPSGEIGDASVPEN